MSATLAPFFCQKRNKVGQKTVSLHKFVLHNTISTLVDVTFGFSGHFCPVFFAKIPCFYAILRGLSPHANKLYMPAKKKPQTAPICPQKNPYTVAMSKIVGEEVVAEHRFHDTRKWRFDYAVPSMRIALEVEGGVWTGGRHTSATGFMRDMEKYNEAALNGWVVLRCTPKTLWSDGLRMLAEAVKFRRQNII